MGWMPVIIPKTYATITIIAAMIPGITICLAYSIVDTPIILDTYTGIINILLKSIEIKLPKATPTIPYFGANAMLMAIQKSASTTVAMAKK